MDEAADGIARAADLIGNADALLICAGAGMGVDSGLPDFRGPEGFWEAYPALRRANLRFDQIACPEQFELRPERAWGFYGHRLDLYRRTVPHAGFGILREWAGSRPRGGFVFTSNVDGQFQRAGFDEARVCEIHGSIHHLQCPLPCRRELWPAEDFQPVIDEARCRLVSPLPICERCASIARPNILMFSDMQWIGDRTDRQVQRLEEWLDGCSRPVVVEMGAGCSIPSVRNMSRRVVRTHSADLIRINTTQPEVDGDGVSLRLPALDALTRIQGRIQSVCNREGNGT
jgi:NAD-dependent SIR2 family protein deacetylase